MLLEALNIPLTCHFNLPQQYTTNHNIHKQTILTLHLTTKAKSIIYQSSPSTEEHETPSTKSR